MIKYDVGSILMILGMICIIVFTAIVSMSSPWNLLMAAGIWSIVTGHMLIELYHRENR